MKRFGRVMEAEETRGCEPHMMLWEDTCDPGTWIHADLSLKLLFHFTRLQTTSGLRARAHAGTGAGTKERAGTDGESVGLPPASDPATQSAGLRPPEPVRAVGRGPPAAQGTRRFPPQWKQVTGAQGQARQGAGPGPTPRTPRRGPGPPRRRRRRGPHGSLRGSFRAK